MDWMKKTLGRSVALTLIMAGVFLGFWLMARPYLKITPLTPQTTTATDTYLAIQKAQEAASIENRLEQLGLECYAEPEDCNRFLKRVIKNPGLYLAVGYAKEKNVSVIVTQRYSGISLNKVFISYASSDEAIIEYFKTGKKPPLD